MKVMQYSLVLLICFSWHAYSCSPGVMFHCQINNEWIDLFFDNHGVAHYVHRKNGVVDLSLNNKTNEGLFKISFQGLSGGGEAHVKFSNKSYDYYLYDITAHSGEDYTFVSGVAVLKDGVLLSNRECMNDATICSDAYEHLPEVDQGEVSFFPR
jgi:hypothetical protein